jgi:hypothetical protein
MGSISSVNYFSAFVMLLGYSFWIQLILYMGRPPLPNRHPQWSAGASSTTDWRLMLPRLFQGPADLAPETERRSGGPKVRPNPRKIYETAKVKNFLDTGFLNFYILGAEQSLSFAGANHSG